MIPPNAVRKIGLDIAAGHQPREEDCAVIRGAIQGAKPMEVAALFAELAGAGCMDVEVARITGRTLRNVKTLSAVYADADVRALVSTGQVPVTLAYQAIDDSALTGLPALATLQAAIVQVAKKQASLRPSKSAPAAVAQLPAIQMRLAGINKKPTTGISSITEIRAVHLQQAFTLLRKALSAGLG